MLPKLFELAFLFVSNHLLFKKRINKVFTADLSVTGGPQYVISSVASGVAAGTYGSASQFTNFTVDTYGRITAASTTPTDNHVRLGSNAGLTSQGDSSVAIGFEAAKTTQAAESVAIGPQAAYTNQGTNAIAIGAYSAYTNQAANAIAIGGGALDGSGLNVQGNGAVAIGGYALSTRAQGFSAIAIGYQACINANQPQLSVAIGANCPAPGANGRLAFGNGMEALATSASTGANGATPLQVAGYLNIEWNGTLYKIPAYLA